MSLVESREQIVALTTADVAQLRQLGEQMASTSVWWGASSQSATETSRCVVRATSISGDLYRVAVINMVGVMRLASVQLEVAPKIPLGHFIYLISRSEIAPRQNSSKVEVARADSMVEILCRWYLSAAEALMRHGLRTDYRSFVGEEPAIRGQLVLLPTALDILQGRPVVHCSFEELSENAPLNRLLLAACQRLSRLPLLSVDTRSRARRLAYRMEGVGPLQSSDRSAEVDRISSAYGPAISLARLILSGPGVSLSGGDVGGQAFLVRTPDLIENSIRSLVREALPDVSVKKQRLMVGSSVSMNPDLVFNFGEAVGDVKYRYLSSDWSRDSLYQSIAFATAFRSRHALIIGLAEGGSEYLPHPVNAGDVRTTALAWNTESSLDPHSAARRLQQDIEDWWKSSVANVR